MIEQLQARPKPDAMRALLFILLLVDPLNELYYGRLWIYVGAFTN